MAEDDHALNLVGHQLPDVPPLALLIPVAHEHQEFVAVGLIGGQDLVEHLGEEPVVELGQDDAEDGDLVHVGDEEQKGGSYRLVHYWWYSGYRQYYEVR